MKKIVIWFLGSNATGKTSQAAMIHKKLKSDSFVTYFKTGIDEEQHWIYTQCGKYTANLGKFTHPILLEEQNKRCENGFQIVDGQYLPLDYQPIKMTDCCGTDTMSKKAQIISSFENACESLSRIIVVEGIMATGTWIEFLKTPKTIVFIIHLKIDLEDNLKRLAVRRGEKKNISPNLVEFKPKTVENISGKIRGFASLYKRMTPKADYNMEIDAMGDINVINKKILKKLNKIINYEKRS